ncbi:MAG: DUF4314 domain-containing protein [Ruthenibacterium sp.]
MQYVSKKIEKTREEYPEGTRVMLVFMDDSQAPLSGTFGTVCGVDDIGQIHVHWDSGSSLALNPEEDIFRKIERSESEA